VTASNARGPPSSSSACSEAHREAMLELSVTHSALSKINDMIPDEPAEVIDAANTRVDDAGNRHTDALFEFLTTAPVTMAGVLAALDYAASPMFPNEQGANGKQTVQLDGSMARDEDLVEAGAQFPAMIAGTLRRLIAAA
jgi:hypothetical protein